MPHSLECTSEHDLARISGTPSRYERDSTVPEVFQARVDERPDAIAADLEGSLLSYRELDERADRLAHRLRGLGVGRGTRVGICLERSLEMVIALVAILKAGGTYLALDHESPLAHLDTLLKDTRPVTVCTQAHLRHRLPRGTTCLCLDAIDLSAGPGGRLDPLARSLDSAYVGYTSGSTGAPKGAQITHRGILRLLRGQDYVNLGPDERLLGVATLAFDGSTFEIWGALLNGARLVLFPPERPMPDSIDEVCLRQGVTTLQITPVLFNRLVDRKSEALQQVRQILVGGDVLSPAHVARALRRMRPDGHLINVYGPTEVTTNSCFHRMPAGSAVTGPIPIGRPIANTHVYLLDDRGWPVDAGASGELYIGGDGVATGYLNRPELTAGRFLPDPGRALAGRTVYRSGDRARLGADGTLEFLGRIDRQVKIRGFRVEPSEVEHVLLKHPDVLEVAVSPWDFGSDDRRLVAHVVPVPGARLDTRALRAFTAAWLPAHLVPSAWTVLARLPLTSRGKLDRSQLPAPGAIDTGAPSARPVDELERRLIAIWEAVLDVSPIAPSDDFFDLGGHSLMAGALFAEIESELGMPLALATIFEASTVAGLAQVIRQEGWKAHWQSLVALRTGGKHPPLFCATAGDGNSVGFAALANRLSDDQPVYALVPRGLDGRRPFAVRVEEMAAHYVREIRKVAPHGPYLLAGRCLGGKVVLEMAQRLCARGERVALLAILDDLEGPASVAVGLAGGVPYDDILSRVRERARREGIDFGDVSTPRGTDRLLAYARGRETGTARVPVSRYLYEAWLRWPDVRSAYPDLRGRGAAELVNWGWTTGHRDAGMAPELLSDPVGLRRPRSWPGLRSNLRRAGASAQRTKLRGLDWIDVVGRGVLPRVRSRRAARLREITVRALREYRARPYPGVITHLASQERAQQLSARRWRDIALGGVEEHVLPGSHRTLLREPDVAGLADCLAECIDRALAQRTTEVRPAERALSNTRPPR